MSVSKKGKNTILILMAVVCLFIAVCSVAYFCTGSYRKEANFKEYVALYFNDAGAHKVKGVTAEEIIKFNEPLSVAMKYPKTGIKAIDDHISSIVTSAEEEFYQAYADTDKKDQIIRFISYDAYKPTDEAISIVMVQEDQRVDKHEVKTEAKKVYTYNFSTATGKALKGINIFNGGYRAFFSQHLLSYFQENHAKDMLEGYENYLAVSGNNFKDFVLTDTGVKFFFQPGTVMDQKKGIVSVETGYQELGSILREGLALDAIDSELPMVALTYDDGPYPPTSNRILDCLEKYGQVATFFELGKKVSAYPEITARKVKMGMQIGNHSWSHANLKKATDAEIAAEINDTNAALQAACGQSAAVMRPPYGNTTPVVEQMAGVPVILWSVDTLDWKSRDAGSVFNSVKSIHDQGKLNGRVILMHSIYDSTAEATEMLVPWLLENNYQLVTVTDLIKYSYGEEPQAGKLYGYGYFYK